MPIVGVIVAGIVIGILGKVLTPGGKGSIPTWLTALCGVGGVLLGWFMHPTLSHSTGSVVDWGRWITAIALGVVLVVNASIIVGRRSD